ARRLPRVHRAGGRRLHPLPGCARDRVEHPGGDHRPERARRDGRLPRGAHPHRAGHDRPARMSTPAPAARSSQPVVLWVAAGAVVVSGFAFVIAGRGTHHDEGVLAGALGTAWPFLLALAAGWLLARAWRRPAAPWPTGAIVWLVTVAGGLALRAATGGGLAGGFPYVAAGALALLLIGWRVLARLLAARR